jgi:hypothetical protein
MLGPDHGQVGSAVTAQRDRGRQVQQHLARVMHGLAASPAGQPSRQRPVQPGQPDRALQQQPTGRRDQRLAGRIQNETAREGLLRSPIGERVWVSAAGLSDGGSEFGERRCDAEPARGVDAEFTELAQAI